MANLDGLRREVTECIDNAYKRGFRDALKESQQFNAENEYRHGLNDAWNCIKKLYGVDCDCLDVAKKLKVFGTDSLHDILKKYNPAEAIAKFKEFEDKYDPKQIDDDEINVGDEIEHMTEGCPFVVTAIGSCNIAGNIKHNCLGIDSEGHLITVNDTLYYKKTGRSFPELVEMLKKMQE